MLMKPTYPLRAFPTYSACFFVHGDSGTIPYPGGVESSISSPNDNDCGEGDVELAATTRTTRAGCGVGGNTLIRGGGGRG